MTNANKEVIKYKSPHTPASGGLKELLLRIILLLLIYGVIFAPRPVSPS